MTNAVYITRTSSALPNAPVENDLVEAVLGQVGERPSRARRIVQRNHGGSDPRPSRQRPRRRGHCLPRVRHV
jgi:hypothetical protein